MRVHLIGIGGVGMAGLAVLLKSQGHEVSGCDLRVTPRTRWLETHGISVFIGHSPDHLTGADEVVVTPAVPKSEDEFAAAAARTRDGGTFRIRTRGEVLAELVNESDGIAVCGSHGKTTTATWIAKLLLALGEDVSWCIGGETGSFPVARASCAPQSSNSPLVVEADESDGTLALYRAKMLVVNACEYDHPDHFKTEADYFACFDRAKRQAGGVIESERLDALADLTDDLSALAPHNRKNARAAVEVALRRGHRLEDVVAALPSVVAELPDRRFQRIAEGVYTDYAHHPTEMRCAVGMARQKCRGRLRVLFQPHRYSRTKALLGTFHSAFEGADEVVLCPTYAAFETPVEGGDIADLYAACRGRTAARLYLARNCDEAWEHARNSMKPGDLTLLLGAGDIIDLAPKIQSDARRAPVRIWIGAGTNTWTSDLNLSVEYRKTSGPANAPGASLGIPWMAGIPGTVGGWVKMNAGAFGHSVSELVEAVKVDGKWISAADCAFGYRHSGMTGEIQDVKWLKDAIDKEKARFSADEFLSRRKKFPAGTFGSFFKNPAGTDSSTPPPCAGKLLEEVGAKELRVGGAHVWSEHANVIVRGKDATPSDVLALARLMRNRVLFRFGISLEPEVCGVSLDG